MVIYFTSPTHFSTENADARLGDYYLPGYAYTLRRNMLKLVGNQCLNMPNKAKDLINVCLELASTATMGYILAECIEQNGLRRKIFEFI